MNDEIRKEIEKLNAKAEKQDELNRIERKRRLFKQTQVSHWSHLFGAFITGGLWIPVWIVIILRANQKQKELMLGIY